MKIICKICPHSCELEENQTGFCRARKNINGVVKCINYGKITSLSLDPIEKKPLYHFHPKSMILSVGSFGCNLTCGFCQNHGISQIDEQLADVSAITPIQLCDTALEYVSSGNIGVAYTYNEPLIGYEFVIDCAKEIRKICLKNILVTNGYINPEPLAELLPFIDAMNIDLKSMKPEFYRRISGDLETVKNTIKTACKSCHVEVTTLIIPNENDSIEEMTELSGFLQSIDENIPLHISRFFPRFKYLEKQPTAVEKIYELADIARQNLKYVYTGNC